MIDWNSYRDWAVENALPCLVVPQGIQGIGKKERWKDDGFYYVGRKKVAPYMVLQRYSGWDILIRYGETENVHRFEKRRWGILHRISRAWDRRTEIVRELRRRFGVKGRSVKLIGMYDDEWYWITIKDNRVSHSKMPKVNEDAVLDELAVRTAGTDDEARWAYLFLLIVHRIDKYEIKVQRLEAAMAWILGKIHPLRDTYTWRKPPVDFVINGRTYPYALGAKLEKESEYWPTPMRPVVNLDSDIG